MSTATLPQDDAGATLTRFDRIRGDRYAEIFLVGGDTDADHLVAAIYNTLGRNSPTGTGDTAPQPVLNGLDLEALAREHGALTAVLNGPRLWCLDWVDVLVGAERNFGGLRARWVMWLDMPRELREQADTAYRPITGRRDTHFGINKGSPAYVLDDPDGASWVMKSISLIVDPTQTLESASDLGSRLAPPAGWRFRGVTLDEDLVLTPHDGTARITQDELGNTYDRVGGPYSNIVP